MSPIQLMADEVLANRFRIAKTNVVAFGERAWLTPDAKERRLVA